MKIFRRIAALFTACVMAAAGMAVSGAAVDYYEIYSGSESTYTFPDNGKVRLLYTADKNGVLTMKFTYTSVYFIGVMTWGDDNYNVEYLRPSSVTASKGTAAVMDIGGEAGDVTGFTMNADKSGGCVCTVKYNVKKGYNLLTLSNESESSADKRKGGKLTVSTSFGTKQASIERLSVTLTKGSTLQLGALLTDSTAGTVKWSSSKSTVAAVSSKGKVTAKKKGTAVITAAYGDSKVKMTVIVK